MARTRTSWTEKDRGADLTFFNFLSLLHEFHGVVMNRVRDLMAEGAG